MSAPSDGARADARKARAEAMGSGRIEDMICPCSFPGYTHVTAVHGQPEPPSDWLAGVIADVKAEERERVAAAIEAVAGEHGGRMMPHASASDCRRCHLSEAARIARAVVTS